VTVELHHLAERCPPALREELVAVCRRVYDRGLTAGVSGNASVRVPRTGAVLIKATGACLGEMTAADTVLVSAEGRILAGDGAPSKELAWHLGIYRARPDVGAIVHAHPPHATAWAVAGRVPHVPAGARAALGEVALVGAAEPGSARLAALVDAAFRRPGRRVALLRDHGVVAAGADLRDAGRLAEQLEDSARVALLAGLVERLDDPGRHGR
jgi:L-fuculose-phosphate aldolase